MTGELARVEHERRGTAVLVRIAGEIDLSNAQVVGEQLHDVVADLDGVVVDLGGLDYIDSSGLALLVRFTERCSLEGRRPCLVVPAGSPARRLLEISALVQKLPLAAGEEEALRVVTEAR